MIRDRESSFPNVLIIPKPPEARAVEVSSVFLKESGMRGIAGELARLNRERTGAIHISPYGWYGFPEADGRNHYLEHEPPFGPDLYTSFFSMSWRSHTDATLSIGAFRRTVRKDDVLGLYVAADVAGTVRVEGALAEELPAKLWRENPETKRDALQRAIENPFKAVRQRREGPLLTFHPVRRP